MNFIEAVTALKEGRCERIKSGLMTVGLTIIENGCLAFKSTDAFNCNVNLLLSDWELVNPIAQYEEVKIVRWLVPETNTLFYNGEPRECDKEKFVKLTGTIKREVKPKVKRREQIGFTGPVTFNATTKIPHDANFFAEWSE